LPWPRGWGSATGPGSATGCSRTCGCCWTLPFPTKPWLEQLADVAGACRDRTFRISREPADAGLREAVLAELDGVGPALAEAVVTSGYAAPLPDLVPALRRVVVEVDPDLGFRLLLRALKAYFMPISEVRYQRLLTLGERFGYHELAVDDGNLNTWPDLVD